MTALPDDPLLQDAESLAAAGRAADAIARLKTGLGLGPESYRRRLLLGRLLFESGAYEEAGEMTRSADPFDPLTDEFAKIGQAVNSRQGHLVQGMARGMLEKVPGHPRATFALAQILRGSGDHEARVAILEGGIAATPANSILRQLYVAALEDAGHFTRAVQEVRPLPKIEPGLPSNLILATVLFKYGQYEDALLAAREALRLAGAQKEAKGEARLVEGQILRVLGRRDEAIKALQESAVNRRFPGAPVWALADMKTHKFSAQDRSVMARLISAPQAPPDERAMAAFSLARALEAEGDWDAAMKAYTQANHLHPEKSFSPDSFRAAIEKLTQKIGSEALSETAKTRADATPIFIVGLPRSGSTLIEQILASHSEIEGTIESLTLPAVKRRAHLIIRERTNGEYADGLGQLTSAELTELGEVYREESKLFRSTESRFYTDKLPHNFEHVSLISKVLPDAIIIDARRNPLDCGLSIYKQYFAKGSPFAYDLHNIAAYYRGFLALMDHWDSVLPGRVLRVQHEELVRDPASGIARILDHIGVSQEDACFRPHETQRAVRTASSEQVRQPISTKGIGTWKKAGAHLDSLREALGEDVLSRFDGFYE
ncbi:tetratricopeptide repeat-containing sulfotransferase family protein [Parvularcula mediterranea]|nr:sulfotransferase [Parvularcula mediterranea]